MCHNGLVETQAPQTSTLLQNRKVVLFLLFCVMGPLALRLLWSSPHFKLSERVALSALSVLEMILIFYLLARGYSVYLLSIGADGPT